MKLIIGLGNPGEEYKSTRHNVGYMVIDELKTQKLKLKSAFVSKTNTFMNESGEFVKHLISQYPNISISDIYIVHDDLDIKLGEYKIQFGRGPRDHNGILDIEDKLGTKDFWRVRVGIDNRPLDNKPMGEEYVLQNFTTEELEKLRTVIKEVCREISHLLQ